MKRKAAIAAALLFCCGCAVLGRNAPQELREATQATRDSVVAYQEEMREISLALLADANAEWQKRMELTKLVRLAGVADSEGKVHVDDVMRILKEYEAVKEKTAARNAAVRKRIEEAQKHIEKATKLLDAMIEWMEKARKVL